jgi:hypothetical protein
MAGLTDREAYLDLRARYIRLVAALRLSRDHNPATLEAIERIVEPEVNARRPYIVLPLGNKKASEEQERHAA